MTIHVDIHICLTALVLKKKHRIGRAGQAATAAVQAEILLHHLFRVGKNEFRLITSAQNSFLENYTSARATFLLSQYCCQYYFGYQRSDLLKTNI